MTDRLKDKVAVVTGAGNGIGRAIALAIAAEGAKVVVNDLGCSTTGEGASSGPADQVAEEIRRAGGTAVANYDSVATMAGGQAIVQTAINQFGRIDILANVAGNDRGRMVFNLTEEEWDVVIDVHLKGTFITTKFASQLMRQQKSGRIINCTSAAGLIGEPGHSNYCAAKAGIAGFTRAVARELGRYGITVNAFMPGAATRMAGLVTEEIWKKRVEEGTALPGISWPLPPPEDVAPVVAYLATDEAAHINGQIIGVIGPRVFLYNHPTEVKTIYKKEGRWTVEDLIELVPLTLGQGLVNPAPPKTQ